MRLKKRMVKYLFRGLSILLFNKSIYESRFTQTPIRLRHIVYRWVGLNRTYWPTSIRSKITNRENILVGADCAPGIMPGCYIYASGGLLIGDGTQIGPNVGIITNNHDPADLSKSVKNEPVIIGKNCWIGMNSVILPGVILGNNTLVGAGSVVAKSFQDGACMIAGNPANIIKHLDIDLESGKRIINNIGFLQRERFKTHARKHIAKEVLALNDKYQVVEI